MMVPDSNDKDVLPSDSRRTFLKRMAVIGFCVPVVTALGPVSDAEAARRRDGNEDARHQRKRHEREDKEREDKEREDKEGTTTTSTTTPPLTTTTLAPFTTTTPALFTTTTPAPV